MSTAERASWEARYAETPGASVEGAEPDRELLTLLAELTGTRREPERGATAEVNTPDLSTPDLSAVDLGAGTGRNTRPLVEAGLRTTAVDFSPSAIAGLWKRALAEGWDRGLLGITGDLVEWMGATAERYDLVVGGYLQGVDGALESALGLLAPGGRLLWKTHAPESPHGPPPTVPRPQAAEVRAAAAGVPGIVIERLDTVGQGTDTVDIVLLARRV